MREIWLRTNARALYFGMVLPAALAAIGLVMAVAPLEGFAVWMRGFGWVLVGLGTLLIVMLAWQSRQPRLAYEPGFLLVHLRWGSPIRVPIAIVEAAFLGAGPTQLTGARQRELRTANLVIRLADKAADWAQRDVNPNLGKWCEGYITIRGTWCEPLTLDLIRRLNTRLADAARQDKDQRQADLAQGHAKERT